MTKEAYRRKKRTQPIGKEGVEACRRIMREGYEKVNEVMVDAFSAGAIVAVYDALGEKQKAHFETLPVHQAASISFRLVKKYGR